MNPKKRLWHYLSAIAVLLLLLSPEFVHIASFIDAVGLEFVLLLVEIQAVVIFRKIFI